MEDNIQQRAVNFQAGHAILVVRKIFGSEGSFSVSWAVLVRSSDLWRSATRSRRNHMAKRHSVKKCTTADHLIAAYVSTDVLFVVMFSARELGT
jgi:uncharacterized phosphosugar-binding protein